MRTEAPGLEEDRCIPCEGGVTALGVDEVRALLTELGDNWNVVGDHHLAREYRFLDFADALRFANRVGELAEAEGHHPDLLVGWGRVSVTLFTHAVDGLTKNDFILAAKIEQMGRNASA